MLKHTPTPYNAPPPVTLAPEFLPLGDLNFPWERFEAFCRELILCLPKIFPDLEEGNHYGKKGNNQKGIDLIAKFKDGAKWVFQCRQYEKYNKKQMQNTIAKATYKADRYYLLLSCEATTDVRDTAETVNWIVWDVRDISMEVRQLDRDVARRLISDHFGASWAKAFLQLGPDGFQTAEEFFAPWADRNKLFNHAWELVGRQPLLNELKDFIADPTMQVLTLVGRGGIGKSKILYTLSQDFSAQYPGWKLLFLDRSASLSSDVVNELAPSPTTIVVDDAHSRDDLQILLGHLARRAYPTKILLALRPYGRDRLSNLLRDAGFDSSAIASPLEVQNLKRDEVEELARQSLGPQFSNHASRLAQLTADCPLITVIAGKMLSERQVLPELLYRDHDFRYQALNRFSEILLGEIGNGADPTICRSFLQAFVAVAPFRDNQENYVKGIAQFVGVPEETICLLLRDMENAGVLLRRGNTLRITPDVLADHILHEACLNAKLQTAGFADRIFGAFSEICPVNVLRNLAELDWKLQQAEEDSPNLLAKIWSEIAERFRAASHSKRCRILDLLDDTAFYQPKQAMEFVHLSLTPSITLEDERDLIFYRYSHTDVLHKLPSLLQKIGYNLDYLPYCCDLLWELGRDDSRPPNPLPGHPIRILQDFAEYQPEKPFQVYQIILEAVWRWLKEPDANQHEYSPLDFLEPLLRKEGHSTEADRHTITTKPFLVSPENTKALREEALQLVREYAQLPDLWSAVRAIDTLDKALAQPIGVFSMPVAEEVYVAWEPEQLHILEMLEDIVRQAADAVIPFKVANAIQWEASLSRSTKVKEKAKAIIASIPETLDYRLTCALANDYSSKYMLERQEDSTKALERHNARLQQVRQSLVVDFIEKYPSARAGLEKLHERIAALERIKTELYISPFIRMLAESCVEYSVQICQEIIANPQSRAGWLLPTFLVAVRVKDAHRAYDITSNALKTDDLLLTRSISVSYSLSAENYLSEDFIILKMLAVHPDQYVRQMITDAIPPLWSRHPQQAQALALSVRIDDDANLARGICSVFCNNVQLSLDNLRDEEIDSFLLKLLSVATIDDYTVGKFLNLAAKRRPQSVIDLFRLRVEYAEQVEQNLPKYSPLPTTGFQESLSNLLESEKYADLLRNIRDDMLRDTWQTRFWLPILFREVSLQFNETSLLVLAEWINSGDKEKIVLASQLLKGTPKSLLFSSFASNLLRQANLVGHDTYKSVCVALYSIVHSGVRTRIPGLPDSEDIYIRDQSQAKMQQFSPGSPEHRFYEELRDYIKKNIDMDQMRDEELEDY